MYDDEYYDDDEMDMAALIDEINRLDDNTEGVVDEEM